MCSGACAVRARTLPVGTPGGREVWGLTARPGLAVWTLPAQRAAVPPAAWTHWRPHMARGRWGAATAQAIPTAPQPSLAGRRGAAAWAWALRRLVRQGSDGENPGAALQQARARRAGAWDAARRTSPGLGPALAAARGARGRLTDAEQLVALVGVEPPWYPSGQTAGQTQRRKTGLVRSAAGARACRPDSLPPCPEVARRL
jgi:hypothetical protein